MDKIVQYIIVRKDLDMSPGKMSAQVAHASLGIIFGKSYPFVSEWAKGQATKIILKAKDLNDLEKVMDKLGDNFFKFHAVYDACHTELERETDKGTLTCIGVQPFLKSKIHPLIKRYQLYK